MGKVGTNIYLWQSLLIPIVINPPLYVPFEVVCGRRCRSPIFLEEGGDSRILGPEVVQETTNNIKLIKKRMKAVQSR